MQIYRFGDFVAVTPPKGDTQYFSAEEAALIAQAMSECSSEIARRVPFTDSQFGSVQIEATGSRYGKE